jgi:hypothetical protein
VEFARSGVRFSELLLLLLLIGSFEFMCAVLISILIYLMYRCLMRGLIEYGGKPRWGDIARLFVTTRYTVSRRHPYAFSPASFGVPVTGNPLSLSTLGIH